MQTNENALKSGNTIELDPRTATKEKDPAEIHGLISGFIDFLPERKSIMEKITSALDDENYKYSVNPEEPGHLCTAFGTDTSNVRLDIILFNCKIIFRLSFPFRCQSYAMPIVAMYLMEANENKAFSRLNLNKETGEITMEYSYLCGKAEYFNKGDFKLYFGSLIHPAMTLYSKLSELCRGIIPPDEHITYVKSLKNALNNLEGRTDQDIERLKEGRIKAGLESPLHDSVDEIMIKTGERKEISDHKEKRLEKKYDEKRLIFEEGVEVTEDNIEELLTRLWNENEDVSDLQDVRSETSNKKEKKPTLECSYKELFSSFAKNSHKEDVSTTGGADE